MSSLDDTCEPRVRGRARNPSSLGHRLARDLLDVGGERDRRRGADRHPDTIRMDGALRGFELADPARVQAPRDEDPDMSESGLVEPGADLFDQVDGDSPALAQPEQLESMPSKAVS